MAETIMGKGTTWLQKVITVPAKRRGVHIITDLIQKMPELKRFKIGLAHLMIQHTSASIALNECWDPSVRVDMETMLNRVAPDNDKAYTHTLEGPDDMAAHVKCAYVGANLTIPITNGQLNIGSWQGIWLCEHRNHAGSRRIVVTLQGCED